MQPLRKMKKYTTSGCQAVTAENMDRPKIEWADGGEKSGTEGGL